MNPRARIEALLVAARAVFGPARAPTLAHELAEEAQSSEAVVTDALDRWLELSPEPEALDRMVARARPRSAVLVSLSANVVTAPLRAIAWALAASDAVSVRTSRRATRFVDALATASDAFTRLPPSDDHAALSAAIARLPADAAVHAYGGSEAMRALATVVGDRPFEAHGPGFGAIVLGAVPSPATARAVADDTLAFDQRGCLSPRVVLVVGDSAATARVLHEALTEGSLRLPRGALDPTLRAALARLADVARMVGEAHVGAGHAVFDLGATEPTLSPGGRSLTVHAVPDRAAAERAIAALGDRLTQIATDLPLATSPLVRVGRPGEMQRPPFDGPVDLRPVLVEERQ